MWMERDDIHPRLTRHRAVRGLTDPACQGDFRDAHAARGDRRLVFELRQRTAGRQHVRGFPLAPSIGSLSGAHLESGGRYLCENAAFRRLGVVTLEPRERGGTLYRRHTLDPLCLSELDHFLCPLDTQPALARAGELLHDPDLGHRHEVLGQTELVLAGDGNILYPELQRRIGPLPGCGCHIL